MRRSFCLLLVAVVGTGCGEPAPGIQVDDPHAYVREHLLSTANPTWARTETPAYNLDDPAFIDSVIDATLDRQARDLNGSLPADSRQLDRFVRDAARSYSTSLLDTPKRRADVEARIRERFETSPVELRSTTAVTDLGLAPGRFEPSRTSWKISESTEASAGFLQPQAIAEALGRMQAAQPTANAFLIDVEVPHGASTDRVRYHYSLAGDRLRMRKGTSQYVWSAPVGGIDGLRVQETPRHVLDVFDLVCASDSEPDCPDVWTL